MTRQADYNPAAGDIGVCVACGCPIRHGQPYMPAIPFRGSWRGHSHRYCPPRLVTITTLTTPEDQ